MISEDATAAEVAAEVAKARHHYNIIDGL